MHKRVLVIALLKLDFFTKKKVVNIYHVILLIVFFVWTLSLVITLRLVPIFCVCIRVLVCMCGFCCWRDEGTFILDMFLFFLSFFLVSSLQLQLIGNAGGNVFKGGRCARYTLEADPIQTQARQFTHLIKIVNDWSLKWAVKRAYLHFPLDQIIFASVTVNAEEHELLALLVVAMIITQNLKSEFNIETFKLIIYLDYFIHHCSGIHWTRRFHWPCESISRKNVKTESNRAKKTHLSDLGLPFCLWSST